MSEPSPFVFVKALRPSGTTHFEILVNQDEDHFYTRDLTHMSSRAPSDWPEGETDYELDDDGEPRLYVWHRNLKEWCVFLEKSRPVMGSHDAYWRFKRLGYPYQENSSPTSCFLNTRDDSYL